MSDRIVVRDRETKETLMILEGDEVEITEALKKKRERKKKVDRRDRDENRGAGE